MINTLPKFLNYSSMHHDEKNEYHKGDMILQVENDISHLSKYLGKSCACAYFYLSDASISLNIPPHMQAPIYDMCTYSKKICNGMGSATERKCGDLFTNI